MTKYVLNYWVYGIVALIFTGLYALITWSLCWEMFPISLCTLYLRQMTIRIMIRTGRKSRFPGSN